MIEQATTSDTYNGRQLLKQCNGQGAWYCLTHDREFSEKNERHLEQVSLVHRLSWMCREHGMETPR